MNATIWFVKCMHNYLCMYEMVFIVLHMIALMNETIGEPAKLTLQYK